MLKVTIYDGPGGTETSFVEGVTEPGGTRRVTSISQSQVGQYLVIKFDNTDEKIFNGFRYILDHLHEESV